MGSAEEAWLATKPLENIKGLPDYGFRLKLDHEFKEICQPFSRPRIRQMYGFVGMGIRYAHLWLKKYRAKKKMFIDNFNLCPWKPIYGAPLGGIGCGTIGRGYKGEFCRFQMVPGMYHYHVVEADQFLVCIRRNNKTVYQQVLSPHKPKQRSLKTWKWQFPGKHAFYHALYPRSWTIYEIPEQKVRLVCRQISPVFPHDYKDTSLPVGVFVWDVENYGTEAIEVSITFAFKNGQGDSSDYEGGVWNEPFEHTDDNDDGCRVHGVMIHQQLNHMPCTYAVAAKVEDNVDVSWKVAFNLGWVKETEELWDDLSADGRLNSTRESSRRSHRGEELACAVCAQTSVDANQTSQVKFSLTWDMPLIHFGGRENTYARRYTRYFGHKGDASASLASYALSQYPIWEDKINKWQKPILDSSHLPTWYKSALFNELYFISDGGTVWVDPVRESKDDAQDNDVSQVVKEYGKFAYLEGHEYRMYNTYDVHHYASFALVMLWPKLQESLQYDIAGGICREQPEKVKYCMSGHWNLSKASHCVPHDIGDPDDEPWSRMNAYIIHPTQEWKDLNTKFVLQVYRDYILLDSKEYLHDMYPHAKIVMEHSLRWDTDNDGIIDNAGFADQTYDAWTVTGASAYCGGMWLAALKMFSEMAKILGHQEDFNRFNSILEKAKVAFVDKLWNGQYYNYDSSTNTHHDSIHADQLAGYWFLKASSIPDDTVFQKEHILSALETIFKCNVMPFSHGTMGAINGMRPNGQKDLTSIQSEEFWTGVTYSLGAIMLQVGLVEKGWQTAYGSYHTCYERYGLAFQTPEAYLDNRQYRSLGYMRPLSIWAIQQAIEQFQPQLLK
ncbi:Non-lysosomal glucosylceramidase [Lamellibrachia satsuma]|nr:Non-lysosomal glucosylceramidase [Lamellibrachia satsuma]